MNTDQRVTESLMQRRRGRRGGRDNIRALRHRRSPRLCVRFFLLICVYLCSSAAISFAAPPETRFEPQTIDDAISIGYGVDVGDVDGDGRPDILLADARQIVWYRNPGKAGEAWPKYVIAENLTPIDNVCITARDINGDGKVEVAIGAQWNPGETTDPEKSGAIFYLIRPEDPTQKWEPVQIKPHEPTVHRMRWVAVGAGKYVLAVLPLHGRGNVNGEGEPSRMTIYRVPETPRGPWVADHVNTRLNLTHNFDVTTVSQLGRDFIFVAGRQGMVMIDDSKGAWTARDGVDMKAPGGAGELRLKPQVSDNDPGFIAVITPMHGNEVAIYRQDKTNLNWERGVIDFSLGQGHALACADLMRLQRDQVIAGWRMPNADKKVGIRMYVPQDGKYETWKTYTIDDNTMACEDLKVADLDGDGKLDIVASGRATKNVVVYWNRTEFAR
jgi:hypothetical protein